MWRLGFLVVIAGFAFGSCGYDEVDIEDVFEPPYTLAD